MALLSGLLSSSWGPFLLAFSGCSTGRLCLGSSDSCSWVVQALQGSHAALAGAPGHRPHLPWRGKRFIVVVIDYFYSEAGVSMASLGTGYSGGEGCLPCVKVMDVLGHVLAATFGIAPFTRQGS